MKKYELTTNSKTIFGVTVYQIKALRDFGDVKIGDLGGWVESENNLSHDDNAWVSGNALVYGNARVSGNAWVYGNARASLNHHVMYGSITTDLESNLIQNIMAQTNCGVFNDEVYCYKMVKSDLNSFFDDTFYYRINEYAEVIDYDNSTKSCARGLHVSGLTYWVNKGNKNNNKLLFCKVRLDDIITVQEGKIRCKKLFVIGVCDSGMEM